MVMWVHVILVVHDSIASFPGSPPARRRKTVRRRRAGGEPGNEANDSTNAFQEQSIKKQHLTDSLQQLLREKQRGNNRRTKALHSS